MRTTSNKKPNFPAVMNTRDLNGKNGIMADTLPELALGGGFSTDREIPGYLSCIDGSKFEFISNPEGNIALSTTQSFSLFEKTISKGWKESLSIGNFSQSASEEYVHYAAQTDYSIGYYFIQTFNLPGVKILVDGAREKALNQLGKDFYLDGPDVFREKCGDKFFSEAKLNGALLASIKLVFKSIEDKKNYTTEAGFGFKFGVIADVSKSVKEIINKYHLNVNVEVSAYQLGGAPWEMGGIFQYGGTSAFSWTPCTRETFEKCQSVINGVLDYSAKTFGQQFKISKNDDVMKIAHVSGYVLPTYEEALGLKVGPSIIDDKIANARFELGGLYSNVKNEQAFIKHILDSSILNSFSNIDKSKIQQTAAAVDSNIKILENINTGAIACYKQPKTCVETLNKIKSTLPPIDENFIDQIRNSYKFTVTINECYGNLCWQKAKDSTGSTVAIPTDHQGHFRCDFSDHNNTLTILKNNDGTISLSVNGGQPSKMQGDGHGEYEVKIHCLHDNDSAPNPFNSYCFVTDNKDHFTQADLVLESVFDMY